MSNAVVAGLRTTATGSGGDGVCSISGVLMGEFPDYVRAASLLIANARLPVGMIIRIPIVIEQQSPRRAVAGLKTRRCNQVAFSVDRDFEMMIGSTGASGGAGSPAGRSTRTSGAGATRLRPSALAR